MAQTKQRELPAAVESARQRIERWRSTREKRGQMPEELWEEAVSLARTHGLWAISRALGVNYMYLKMRCGPAGARGRRAGKAARWGFVELAPARINGGPAEASGPVLELSRPDGATLTIRLAAREALDVAALAGAFWGGGR